MTTTTRKYLDWLWLMACNFMWATQAPAIKLIGDRLGPVAIAFLPMLLSTLLFLPALWYEGRRLGRPFQWRWGDARHFAIAGLFGFFFLQITYVLGAQRTLAANAGIITLSIPVLVAICASIMLKEKLNPVRAFGFVLALAGVLLTSMSDIQGASFRSQYLLGNTLFLLACAGSAFYNTYCKLLVDKKYTELEILVYTSIAASLASIPLFIWVEPLSIASLQKLDKVAVWGVLELTVFVYGLSMLLFFFILKRLDVTQATISNYVLPFFIGVLAVVVLKESITPVMLAGGAIILVSTIVVTVYESEILNWLSRKPRPLL
ncbi:MAG TPA: DMT family transporter [Bryobacteraceae bacterium]|nr:DMT family transporter [Bryobacteraceae bacterium]